MVRVRNQPTGDSSEATSIVSQLASETLDWMAEDPSREDVADEVWAFALATHVGEIAITPMGYDVTDQFSERLRCFECGRGLGEAPKGSTLCAGCFLGWSE